MKSRGLRSLLFWGLSFLLLKPAAADDALLKEGRKTFEQHCARCHGINGTGAGIDARRLPVRPRNFTLGEFKFRTTAFGTAPADEDLMWVLNNGMSGAGMPSFATLNSRAREAVIAFLKTFSSRFEDFPPEKVHPPNTDLKPDFAKGREMYEKLQCWQCHGKAGRANGPSAETLRDSQGNPIRAANLSQGWTYRAGGGPRQIYYRLMTGIEGTPMPAYDGVPEDQAWHLANYVASLQIKADWKLSVDSVNIEGDLPAGFEDSRWSQTSRTDVNVQNNVFDETSRKANRIHAISVSVLNNARDVAFRLFWDDPTESVSSPGDTILMAFKPQGVNGGLRENLHTLYKPGAPSLDFVRWNASEAGLIKMQRANLYQAIHSPWGGAQGYPARAEFTDGRWTLVFRLPRADLPQKYRWLSIGFSVWDGRSVRAWANRSSSRWITLNINTEKQLARH